MRQAVLTAILSMLFLSTYMPTHTNASNSLDIQRYKHRGCVLSAEEHYPPDYAQVGLKDTFWYGGEPEYVDFEYKNCREAVTQAQDSCDLAVEYPGYLPSQEREECHAQYRGEVSTCRAHYDRQFEACESIKSPSEDRTQPAKDSAEEPLWEELLPSDTLPPGWEELLPEEPYDHAALDRELYRQENDLEKGSGQESDLDEALERLALQVQEIQRLELERTRQEEMDRELEQERVEREAWLKELEDQHQKVLQAQQERQERERIARAQRQREVDEGISTFFQLLGAGAQIYNMYNQLSPPDESLSTGSSPSYTKDVPQSESEPLPFYEDDTSRGR